MDTLEIAAVIIAIVIIFVNNGIAVRVVCVGDVELRLGCFFSLQFPDTQAVTCFNSHYSGNMREGYIFGKFLNARKRLDNFSVLEY